MTEYESQHRYWKRDHDTVMVEMERLKNTGPTWTVVSVTKNWPGPGPAWGDCYDWCIATWGRNDAWVYMGPGKFHFKNKSDAAMFILKWVQ